MNVATKTLAGLARKYSRSDRSRYYWPRLEVARALQKLTTNLDRVGIPAELASQHLAWLRGPEPAGVELTGSSVTEVLRLAVGAVLDAYDAATSPPRSSQDPSASR
jgi:D-tagatose-1,6-bisphosphate aldolase subunit GatZ/KbaZ